MAVSSSRAGSSSFTAWRTALGCYLVTLAIVSSGIAVGIYSSSEDAQLSPDRAPQSCNRFRDTLTQWDGQWYQKIALEGYSYDRARKSAVAFFPLYPMTGRLVAALTRLPMDVALLLVSHGFLIAGLACITRYARESVPSQSPRNEESRQAVPLATWVLALFPTSFFMVMAYSESLCLTLTGLTMWGIKRNWPAVYLVLLVALSTAARPVGVALLPPLILHLWHAAPTRRTAITNIAQAVPLALSGLGLYMVFQYFAFDTPLAFVQSQDHWGYQPRIPLSEKLIVLLSWEPVWAVYVPDWPTSWASRGSSPCIFASLQAANPVLFTAGAIAVMIGWSRRWLTQAEVLLSAGMLAIPYLTRAYEMNMAGHGRFLLPVFPIFLVIGRVLQGLPVPLRGVYLTATAAFLFAYSWMWAKGYVLI